MADTRPLTDRQRALLDFLLATEFPGVQALRIQAHSVRVRVDGIEDPTFIELEVDDPNAPRAEVASYPAVETTTSDLQPPQDLILFVKEGKLSVLELVVYGDSEVTELPEPAVFRPPWPSG